MSRPILSPTERLVRRATKRRSDQKCRAQRNAYGKRYQAKVRARMSRLEMVLAVIVACTPLPTGLLEQVQEALKL